MANPMPMDVSNTTPKILSDDISDGKTKYPIRVVASGTKLPSSPFPKFTYALEPYFRAETQLPKRQFCDCVGDCSEQGGCLCVQLSTVKLAKPGRIRDRDVEKLSENGFNSVFCECSPDCKCAGKCTNRLSHPSGEQRHQLEIFWKGSRSGYVCKTLKPIRRGAFVCFLAGEVLIEGPETETVSLDMADACFSFQDQTRQLNYKIRMDRIANEARFFNSSCCPNLMIVHIFHQWICPELPKIAFVALNEINSDEELTFYYGDHWLLSTLLRTPNFHCHCKAPFCIWPPQKEQIQNDEQLIEQTQSEIDMKNEQRARERHLEKKRRVAEGMAS